MGTVATDVVEGNEDADDDAEVPKTKSKWLQRLLNHKVCDARRRGIEYIKSLLIEEGFGEVRKTKGYRVYKIKTKIY